MLKIISLAKISIALFGLVTLQACSNPLSGPTKIDANYSPGYETDESTEEPTPTPVPTPAPTATPTPAPTAAPTPAPTPVPVAKTWSVDTASATEFALSRDTIEYTASSARHKVMSADLDASNEGFGGRTATDKTEYSGGGMTLSSAGLTAKAGSFTSRVFSASTSVSWSNLSWVPDAPSLKRYPDNQGVESIYDRGNIDMTDNVLLYHMEEASWNGTDGEVKDSSGKGLHGKSESSATTIASSRFGRAGTFNGSNSVLGSESAELDSTDKFTAEAWIYPTIVDSNPRPILAKRVSSGASGYAFAFFLYTGGKLFADVGSSGSRQSGNITFAPNNWYHVVMVFDGTLASGKLKTYVNGVLDINATIAATTIPHAASPLTIGRMASQSSRYVGRIDEVAIYRRALTAGEVATRYQRGSQRLSFQVRTCANSDCSDGSFTGPDGSNLTFYGESQSTSAGFPSIPLSLSPAPYFQYKAFYDLASSSDSPKLKSLTLSPQIYDSGYPTLTSTTGVAYTTLSSFSATLTGTVRFQISNNGTNWFYWDGSAWSAATGFTQSNNASIINANIAAFAANRGAGTLYFKAYFDSGATSTSRASLSSVTVNGAL